MLITDVEYLRCPSTRETLSLVEGYEEINGKIFSGLLVNMSKTKTYKIQFGIPRFYTEPHGNSTWEYKWRELDKGTGLNYLVLNKNDPAYNIHDIFDRNDHQGKAYKSVSEALCLDIGCGIGQNTIKLINDYEAKKVIAIDLQHSAVEIFSKIVKERYPHLEERILIVQGNAHFLPFETDSFGYVLSLGCLHHSGNTLQAIAEASRVARGEINFWIYASDIVPIESKETGREIKKSPFSYFPKMFQYSIIMFWLRLFRVMPHSISVCILKVFSSATWYYLSKVRFIRFFCNMLFPVPPHPRKDYRLINLYDGYINTYQETWSESEIFDTLKQNSIVIKGISKWRLGIWGTKIKDFYEK